jgi:hypothetical protein
MEPEAPPYSMSQRTAVDLKGQMGTTGEEQRAERKDWKRDMASASLENETPYRAVMWEPGIRDLGGGGEG